MREEKITLFSKFPLCCVFGWSCCAHRPRLGHLRFFVAGVRQFSLLLPLFGAVDVYIDDREDMPGVAVSQRVCETVMAVSTFFAMWSFKCLLPLMTRSIRAEDVDPERISAMERFVLLQMAAAKLLGMLIPRIVTHNLYSETPGGWVMPKHYYVTIITGFMLTVVQFMLSLLGACAYNADETIYPELDEDPRHGDSFTGAHDVPPDALALLDMNGIDVTRWKRLQHLQQELVAGHADDTRQADAKQMRSRCEDAKQMRLKQLEEVVIEPLCGWLLSLGHIFFEEHLKEPVLEVQWALGWMLVEAFKQRRRDPEEVERPKEPPKKRGLSWVTRPANKQPVDVPEVNPREQEDAEAIAMASRLTQFFALLPKLPGKHGAPMLSLALESVAESGLWRRGVLLPHNEDGQTRWLRNFSWPELFNFVHERLPTEMRFRLWRCSLQICVSSPELAPLAEIPFALASAAAEAPPGAAFGASLTPELLQEALDLGADPEALGPLCSRLPVPPKAKKAPALGVPPEAKLLLAPADGVNAENERRAELASLGINIEVWAPSDLEVPKTVPLHHRMRCAQKAKKGPPQKGIENCDSGNSAPPSEELKAAQPEPKRRRFKQAEDAPRLPLQEIRQASRKSAEDGR
eukprot:s2477_g9.t2